MRGAPGEPGAGGQSRPAGPLRPDEIARYERDGFLVVENLLAPEQVKELDRWADELASAPEVPGGVRHYHDDELRERGRELLCRIEYFRPFHAGLRALAEGETLGAPLAQLLGEPARLFKDKINYKLPGSSGFAAHQDVQAGWDAYCPTHLTLLVGIDPSTEENGCLELAPGAHRRGAIGERWRPLEGDALEHLVFRPCPAQAGSAIFFGSYTPHRSAPNRTSGPRRVLYLTYNPASQGDHYEAYFAAKRSSYPSEVERRPGVAYRYRV